MTKKNGALAPTGSACLEKAQALPLELQPTGEALVLLLALGGLLWTA